MKGLPLLIPVAFIAFIAAGLAELKTLAVGTAFAIAIVLGIYWGDGIEWEDGCRKFKEEYAVWAFWGSVAIIGVQLLMLGKVPLLDPAIRTHLNPRLTALTYFLGIPSSLYLFLRGKRYSLVYPFIVALYAYRTPVLVDLLAIGSAYYERLRAEGRLKPVHIAAIALGILLIGAGMTLIRGQSASSLWTRVQSSTSVLDVIVWRGDWAGTYGGELQWAGIASYFRGGYSPRGLVAKFLYVHTGATITPTLLGGMYLDFGIFAILEGLLLGLYYGMIQNARDPFTMSLYYTTLAYGMVGVETGILDLPVYLLFLTGAYVVVRGWWRRRAGREVV